MKAIQFHQDSSDAGSARETELPTLTANGHDILEGHRRLESGKTIGKLTISSWE